MSIQVLVVAAGEGKRLKAGIPKALVPLSRRPLLAYCLKVFEAHPAVDGITVVAPQEHLKAFGRLTRIFKKVRRVVAGGPTRVDSVKCGLNDLPAATRLVLVHDAARPFIDRGIIDRMLLALKRDRAAVAGVPVTFTVKQTRPKTLRIERTIARDLLWEAQTPQGFDYKLLMKAHSSKNRKGATDDAILAERMGVAVRMVMGATSNIKITTPEDLVWARQWLAVGHKA